MQQQKDQSSVQMLCGKDFLKLTQNVVNILANDVYIIVKFTEKYFCIL